MSHSKQRHSINIVLWGSKIFSWGRTGRQVKWREKKETLALTGKPSPSRARIEKEKKGGQSKKKKCQPLLTNFKCLTPLNLSFHICKMGLTMPTQGSTVKFTLKAENFKAWPEASETISERCLSTSSCSPSQPPFAITILLPNHLWLPVPFLLIRSMPNPSPNPAITS